MEKLSICRIDKDISYDLEQVNIEYIDTTHLIKIQMSMSPIEHNFSFTELQNL